MNESADIKEVNERRQLTLEMWLQNCRFWTEQSGRCLLIILLSAGLHQPLQRLWRNSNCTSQRQRGDKRFVIHSNEDANKSSWIIS